MPVKLNSIFVGYFQNLRRFTGKLLFSFDQLLLASTKLISCVWNKFSLATPTWLNSELYFRRLSLKSPPPPAFSLAYLSIIHPHWFFLDAHWIKINLSWCFPLFHETSLIKIIIKDGYIDIYTQTHAHAYRNIYVCTKKKVSVEYSY